jgi:hypothetical protein
MLTNKYFIENSSLTAHNVLAGLRFGITEELCRA